MFICYCCRVIILAARMFSIKCDEYSSSFSWRKDIFSAAFPKLHNLGKKNCLYYKGSVLPSSLRSS